MSTLDKSDLQKYNNLKVITTIFTMNNLPSSDIIEKYQQSIIIAKLLNIDLPNITIEDKRPLVIGNYDDLVKELEEISLDEIQSKEIAKMLNANGILDKYLKLIRYASYEFLSLCAMYLYVKNNVQAAKNTPTVSNDFINSMLAMIFSYDRTRVVRVINYIEEILKS